MPDNVEQPGQAPEPAAPAPPAVPKKPQAVVDPLARLKTKYRLDENSKVVAPGPNNQPLGVGPLMSPEVFDKLASLDHTPDKRYLDWMLYQSGGGSPAITKSLKAWGEAEPEHTPDSLFAQFKREVVNRLSVLDVNAVAKAKNIPQIVDIAEDLVRITANPDDPSRFQQLTALLQQRRIMPGKEEKVAAELLTMKFKKWLQGQDNPAALIKDRVRALTVWGRLQRGESQEQADAAWNTVAEKRRREYLLGDQDAAIDARFGFYRDWPGGRDSRYEKVYKEVGRFIEGIARVKRRNTQLAAYNAQVTANNQNQPGGQQMQLREPVNVVMEIGKVTMDKRGRLSYKGAYPTVDELRQANDDMADLPMRERITGDVRFAGQKGKTGHGEKLYSDANLDVLVPLTMAASIRAGHRSWDLSDPEQFSGISSGSSSMKAWTRYHAGLDAFAGAGDAGQQAFRRVPIMFHVKLPVPPETERILMVTNIDDLVDLQPPYASVTFRIGGGEEIKFPDLIHEWRKVMQPAHYSALRNSLFKALKVISQWGPEFSPRQIVADPVAHYRERMQNRRRLPEEIKLRAQQAVNLLIS